MRCCQYLATSSMLQQEPREFGILSSLCWESERPVKPLTSLDRSRSCLRADELLSVFGNFLYAAAGT